MSIRRMKANFPSSRVRQPNSRPAPATTKEFYDLALKYCSRRETSRARMETYLLRKAKGGARQLDESKVESVQAAIQDALNQLESHQVINDDRYAGILVRDYQRRAKGERYIKLKLREKGLESQINSLERDEDAELDRALQVIEKTVTKTRFKKIESPFELKQKLIQKLVQSGFDLTLSKKAVALKVR